MWSACFTARVKAWWSGDCGCLFADVAAIARVRRLTFALLLRQTRGRSKTQRPPRERLRGIRSAAREIVRLPETAMGLS